MISLNTPLVFANLVEQAKELSKTADWEPFRSGVTAHWLYKDENTGASAVLLKYEPGARVSLHEHTGYEHMFVLDGDEYDEYGTYPAGSFVVNPPGTKHSPGSKGGCVALLIYEKKVKFVESE